MGQITETTFKYEEVLRSSPDSKDLQPGQRPSEWVKMVMREAKRASSR